MAVASLSDGSAAASLGWLCPLLIAYPKEAEEQTQSVGRSESKSSLKLPICQRFGDMVLDSPDGRYRQPECCWTQAQEATYSKRGVSSHP